ncbi:hypothetical protein B296_00056865 [Ensete ventricosum]|uniref:Uncharacterized protein n=1 Tax=Ensete ventricosum TaxID=4639 RepID=A0A426WWZ1_ENSVE|nr:hypothetical protein B296_00056865 [Ensete ventricosum]
MQVVATSATGQRRLNRSLLPPAVVVLPHVSRRHLCRRLAPPQPLPSSFPPFLPQQPHTLCAVFPFSSLIYRRHFCCCPISPPSSAAASAAAPSLLPHLPPPLLLPHLPLPTSPQSQPPLGAPHIDATTSFISLGYFFLRQPPQFLPSS